MPELHNVEIGSPVGFYKFAEATGAEYDEARRTITLLRNVNVIQRLVVNDEYTITSRGFDQGIHARYVGPDHSNPGAHVFAVMPRVRQRARG
jgi:hypothetical protein